MTGILQDSRHACLFSTQHDDAALSCVVPVHAHVSHALMLCSAAAEPVKHDVHTKLHRASNVINLRLPHGNALVPLSVYMLQLSHHARLV